LAANISVDVVHNNKVLCLFIADLMEHDPLKAELAKEMVLRGGRKKSETSKSQLAKPQSQRKMKKRNMFERKRNLRYTRYE
jgi:uncharacterized protein YneF (UPF0154 family)